MFPNEEIVYFPWYQEPPSNIQPWVILENISQKHNVGFTRVILPWDTSYWGICTKFSLDAVKEKAIDVLEWLKNDSVIAVHSLPAYSIMDAISEISENSRKKIMKLVLIHPAEDLAHSVSMMGWIQWARSKKPLRNINDYLTWDCEIVFNDIIWDWKWDGTQFQKDLNYYHNTDTRNIQERLYDLRLQYSMLRWTHDAIAREWVEFDSKKPMQLLRKHVPRGEVLEKLFFNT